MSDWEAEMRKRGFESLAEKIHTERIEDMVRLGESGLPQYDFLTLPYMQFKKDNNELTQFIEKYQEQKQGFCIRALPTKEGMREGLTRKFKFDYMDYQDMKDFLKENIKEPYSSWNVGLTNWEPNSYGGIIILNENQTIIEMAREEEGGVRATGYGEVIPVRGERGFVRGTYYHGLRYNTTNIKERQILWKALQEVMKNPKTCEGGYFEFVVTERNNKIMFIDYKINPLYLL